jgi:N-acetylneuraminate synthase
MKTFEFGGSLIDEPSTPFIVAEVGVHHKNSLSLAKEYILAASIAGANAVKFQTYQAARLATHWAPTYWDSEPGKTQFDIFSERSRLSLKDYRELFSYSRELGILFFSTPFDEESAEMLNSFDVSGYKMASADITNLPLLRSIAAFGKPVMLSTGAATLNEVRVAVEAVEKGGSPVAILHCTLSYPTRIEDANLRRITLLQESFPALAVGYSDHTQPQDSELACPLAVVLGACIIEKHFTLNKHLDDDDHYHAVDREGLARLVRNCKDAHLMTGPAQELVPAEEPARIYARRSIVARAPIARGQTINETDLDCKRPGTGLPPFSMDQIVGRRTLRDLIADEQIALADLE